MTTIDRLLIRGIRAFDPDNKSTIEFHKPLTLIVGPNGSGKTTIIECLKQVTTGELPPNSNKGHTFITDPKICKESEVKAQIRLGFKTATGQPVMAIRSFRLSQKRGAKQALEFKALECSLTKIKSRSEKVTTEYKTQEMDREMPALMGVPKAVLESVIFVHQEDANWPLDKADVLKKKFDQIFEATRYTKALESMAKMRREHVSRVKEAKLRLETLQRDKDALSRIEAERVDAEAKRRVLMEEVGKLAAESEVLVQRVADAQGKLDRLGSLEQQHGTLDTKLSMLTRQRSDIMQRLDEKSEDSLDQLLDWQKEFDSQIEEMRVKKIRLEGEERSKQLQIDSLKDTLGEQSKELGRMQVAAEENFKHIKELRQLAHQFSAREDLQLPNASMDDVASLQDCIRGFEEHLAKLTANLEENRQNSVEQESKYSEKADEAAEALATARKGLELGEQERKRCLDRMQELEPQLRKLEADGSQEARVQRLKESVATGEARIGELRGLLQQPGAEADLKDIDEQLQTASRKLASLRAKLESSAARAEVSVRLRVKREEISEKTNRSREVLETLKASVLEYGEIGKLDPSTVHYEVQRLLDQEKESAATAQKALADAQSKRNLVLADQSQAQRTLQESVMRAERLHEEVRNDVVEKFEDFGALLEGHQQKLSAAQLAWESDKAADTLYSGFVDSMLEKKECPICMQGFDDATELESVTSLLRQRTQAIPGRVQERAVEVQALQKTLQSYQAALPKWTEARRLRQVEVPSLQARLTALERDLSSCTELQERAQRQSDESDRRLKDVQNMLPTAQQCADLHKEATKLSLDLEDEERRLGLASGFHELDVEALRSEIHEWDTRCKDVQARKESTQSKQRDLQAELSEWQHSVQVDKDALSDIDRQHGEARQAKEETDKLKTQVTRASAEIERLHETLQNLEEGKQAAFRDRASFRERSDGEKSRMQARVNLVERDVGRMDYLVATLKSYEASGREAASAKIEEDIARMKERISAAEKELNSIKAELGQIAEVVGERDRHKRNIEDNIALRRQESEEQEIVMKMEALKQKISEVGEASVIAAERQSLQRQVDAKLAKRQNLEGKIQMHQEVEKSRRTEAKDARYKGVDTRYADLFLEAKTTEMASKDLEKYSKALEKALNSYHANKMEEINKVIRELWQQVYRNSDIDCIQIRADEEGARSYNYRVVMVTNSGHELDMRGRCSAGQKVLACLIIRMALSESFAINCGILTLDEPTTNLDMPNAESLANALLRLVESRRGQRHFQLVIITHDEHFARLIGVREHTENYWRVSKDENQKSIIKQHMILE